MQLTPELITRLQKAAKRETWAENEDFCAYDYSGGNFDDAYEGGSRDGETFLAQEILEALNIEY